MSEHAILGAYFDSQKEKIVASIGVLSRIFSHYAKVHDSRPHRTKQINSVATDQFQIDVNSIDPIRSALKKMQSDAKDVGFDEQHEAFKAAKDARNGIAEHLGYILGLWQDANTSAWPGETAYDVLKKIVERYDSINTAMKNLRDSTVALRVAITAHLKSPKFRELVKAKKPEFVAKIKECKAVNDKRVAEGGKVGRAKPTKKPSSNTSAVSSRVAAAAAGDDDDEDEEDAVDLGDDDSVINGDEDDDVDSVKSLEIVEDGSLEESESVDDDEATAKSDGDETSSRDDEPQQRQSVSRRVQPSRKLKADALEYIDGMTQLIQDAKKRRLDKKGSANGNVHSPGKSKSNGVTASTTNGGSGEPDEDDDVDDKAVGNGDDDDDDDEDDDDEEADLVLDEIDDSDVSEYNVGDEEKEKEEEELIPVSEYVEVEAEDAEEDEPADEEQVEEVDAAQDDEEQADDKEPEDEQEITEPPPQTLLPDDEF